jgi:hypothetical protein
MPRNDAPVDGGLTYKFQPVAYRFHRGETWYWHEGFDPDWVWDFVDKGYATMATRRDENQFTLLAKLIKRD